MADDPQKPDESDRFGWGQKPLHRTDETTGDEGIEPPVGEGHDEATVGPSDRDTQNPKDQVHGYPTEPRDTDAQE